MEAEAGGNVEVGVNVMNVVESPEPREFVVCDVPVVKAQIEQQKAGDKLRPPRKRHEVDQTERSGRSPNQRQQCRGPHSRCRYQKGHRGDAAIDDQAELRQARSRADAICLGSCPD